MIVFISFISINLPIFLLNSVNKNCDKKKSLNVVLSPSRGTKLSILYSVFKNIQFTISQNKESQQSFYTGFFC